MPIACGLTFRTRFGQSEKKGDACLLAFATGQMENRFRSSFPKWFGKPFPTNFPLAATVSHQRLPQNPPGKDRHLGVGCWLRRERVRTFVAVCCERALLAKSVASA